MRIHKLRIFTRHRLGPGATERSKNHYQHLRIPQSYIISCFLEDISSPNFGYQNLLILQWSFWVFSSVEIVLYTGREESRSISFFPSCVCVCVCVCDCVLIAQSCPTFCNPTDWSPPGSSVHGIL